MFPLCSIFPLLLPPDSFSELESFEENVDDDNDVEEINEKYRNFTGKTMATKVANERDD